MKFVLLMTLFLTLITSSCSKYNFTKNTGKCFVDKFKYSKRGYLVFNKDNDYIFWDEDKEVYGPVEDLFFNENKEIKCPKVLFDKRSITINELKRYGVYDEVTKYINIVNKY